MITLALNLAAILFVVGFVGFVAMLGLMSLLAGFGVLCRAAGSEANQDYIVGQMPPSVKTPTIYEFFFSNWGK